MNEYLYIHSMTQMPVGNGEMPLEELFGNSVLVKMVDFFLENRFWDYTKTDVAKHIERSRQSVSDCWPVLEKFKVVVPSRKIGKTVLYKTDPDSPIVKELSKLSLTVANTNIEGKRG